MDIYEKALALHKEHHGKMEINVKVPMDTMEDLSMAYTPGVAQPCREIHNNPETVYDYHRKGDDGKERELHVQQSIDCTKVPADLDQNKLFVNTKLDHGSKTRYLKCEYLTVDHYLIEGSTEIKNDDPFQLVSVIDGEGTVNDMPIKKGDQFIICSDVDLVHYEGGLELMVTTL